MSTFERPSLAVSGDEIQPVESAIYLNKKYLAGPEKFAQREFRNERLIRKLSSLSVNELVLLPSSESGINLDEPESASLTRLEGLEVGRKNSRTEVAFGQLALSQPDTHDITELVAVKYVHPITASREFLAARAVDGRLGERRTFTPLGFIKNNDGRVGVMTRYEHQVNTLDNRLWNPETPEESLQAAYRLAGLAIAELHRNNLIHGDAQAKNLAVDSSGTIRHLDTETYTDASASGLYSIKQRLNDIHSLFNAQIAPIHASSEHRDIFVDNYLQSQNTGYESLPERDIRETIKSAQGDKTY